MQLPTADHGKVTCPDRLSAGLVWIEYVSQANVFGHEVLAQEVESLTAARLLVQHELCAPVVKLLNFANLVYAADGQPLEVSETDARLNFLGLLASDGERYAAEAALNGALGRASSATQEHFADGPPLLSRTHRFMDAVSAYAYHHAIHSPWIHLTIDRPSGGRRRGRLARRG